MKVASLNIRSNLDCLPFDQYDNSEVININHTNSMRFLEPLANVEVINETRTFSAFPSNDINNVLTSTTSSEYYSVNEYHTIKKHKNLNIVHTNVNGLESKLDNLNEFLSAMPTKMDILAITETSEKI